MWSKITEYWNRFFSRPVVGQKRSFEETNECPPRKQMKLDHTDLHDNEDSSMSFRNTMACKENSNCREDDELQCLSSKSPRKKWEPSSMMARKSIRRTLCEVEPKVNEREKTQSVFSSHNHKERHTFTQVRETKDIEVVHYKMNISTHLKNNDVAKPKSISDRILNRLPSSSNRIDSNQSRAPFQAVRKRLGHVGNVLQEPVHKSHVPVKTHNYSLRPRSEKWVCTTKVCLNMTYRLQEKCQYMKLLQSQTPNVLSNFFQPFTTLRGGCNQKTVKPSIPVIDLTKDKTNVIVNKSHESVPWKSSSQTIDILSDSSLSTEEKKVSRVNSLQDVLRTNPVLSEDLVPNILSEHKKEIAEKRRLAAIEAAKLEVLSDSNRKAYSHALEERLRTYMRITTPALDEVQVEEEKYELPELTSEQEQKINNALSPSPAAQVLVEKFGLQIKRRDMQTLKGLNWLNDEVINFYMNLIMERGKEENQPKVYAFNTFFYPKLLSGGHSSLKRWTKKVDIFSHDMVLVPVHLGMHWCMSVMDFRNKQVRYYDSMGSPNDRCLQSLLSYLEAESLDKRKRSYDTSDWEQINVGDIPQQMNGSDCGVFSCMFAEHLARDCPILFTQEHMPYFRRKMVLEILEGKLLT